MTTLTEKMNGLTPARRNKVEARASVLVAEEMSLADLRKAHKLTQQRMAETLHITQDNVSRLEKRSDLLISTLRSYVEAMGGSLSLIVEFPDRGPVLLEGLSGLESKAPPRKGSSGRKSEQLVIP